MTPLEAAIFAASCPAAFLAGVLYGYKHPTYFMTWRKR